MFLRFYNFQFFHCTLIENRLLIFKMATILKKVSKHIHINKYKINVLKYYEILLKKN